MERGTAHGWLTVTWTDGPTDNAVSAITGRYESARFDVRDDGYHATDNTLKIASDAGIDAVRPSCCGVTNQRRISPDAKAYAQAMTGITPSILNDSDLTLWQWLAQTDLTDISRTA